MAKAEYVLLADAANVAEAGAVREYLRSHGVECFVRGEHHASILGMNNPMVGFDLMVRSADLVEARGLLASFRDAQDVDDLEAQALAATHVDVLEGGVVAADDSDGHEALGDGGLAGSPRRAMALALVPSFGFGHFYARQFGMGVVLAIVQLLALAMAFDRNIAYLALAAASVAFDAVLAASHVKAANRRLHAGSRHHARLPAARVVGSVGPRPSATDEPR